MMMLLNLHEFNIYTKTKEKENKLNDNFAPDLTSCDRHNTEIASRIKQAKKKVVFFQRGMKSVLTNKHISIHTRRRALECYIEPNLIYGWTISKLLSGTKET